MQGRRVFSRPGSAIEEKKNESKSQIDDTAKIANSDKDNLSYQN